MAVTFDGNLALGIVAEQLALGPRWPGSPGHLATGDYIVGRVAELGWQVEEQRFDYQGFAARNIVAKANQGAGNIVVLGAHYDTRRLADRTPGAVEAGLPVPGANDGASGVAILLELARVLDREALAREIWLAFFDIEDNGSGGIPGWEYSAGSPYVAESLETVPEAVVIVDMVGDSDQQIYYEGNSDPILSKTLWDVAAGLGYGDSIIPEPGHTMIDDHLPFARLGMPVALMIDFDYPYHHTVEDTLDKVSADSLHRVGRTLEVWLEDHLDR
jgi:Zn-dependent M28 family amino/carboxypeptidase